MNRWHAVEGAPTPFGATWVGSEQAYNFAIYSKHATGVVLKDSAAGVLLGWVFWRLGLPYAIVCHGAANAVHRFTWPMLFY